VVEENLNRVDGCRLHTALLDESGLAIATQHSAVAGTEVEERCRRPGRTTAGASTKLRHKTNLAQERYQIARQAGKGGLTGGEKLDQGIEQIGMRVRFLSRLRGSVGRVLRCIPRRKVASDSRKHVDLLPIGQRAELCVRLRPPGVDQPAEFKQVNADRCATL